MVYAMVVDAVVMDAVVVDVDTYVEDVRVV